MKSLIDIGNIVVNLSKSCTVHMSLQNILLSKKKMEYA